MSIKILNKNELKYYEKKSLEFCQNNLLEQTDKWHLYSRTKVCACIYVKRKNKYFLGQNVNISKVSGAICAERSAIINAISNIPDIKYTDIDNIFILSNKNLILPCGVCCEWLKKINSSMDIYTLYNDEVIKLKLYDFFGDEKLIEKLLSVYK